MTVFTHVKKEDLLKLKAKEEEPKTIYEELRLKKNDVSLVLYTSGKLLLQGSKTKIKTVADELKKLGIGEKGKSFRFRKEEGWMIGSDESLKGDSFGGLVVAGVKADDKLRKELIALGVADSKTLSDKEILPLAEKIKRLVPCSIKSIYPEEYNKNKMTVLLNKLHQECGKFLSPGKHVVDKYPGCVVGEVIEEKAESKYVEVAAASILARAAGLQQLNFLSAEAGFALPKGSTHVQLALQEMKDRGLDFKKFAKVGFSNVREVLSS